MTPVKNQFAQSSCVAFACSELVEYHHCAQTNEKVTFSTEFIYGNRFEEGVYRGRGMVIRDALKTLYKYGDTTEVDCPGNNGVARAMENVSRAKQELYRLAEPYKITSYAKLSGADEIKTALKLHGPVIVSMRWYKGSYVRDNILAYDESKESSNHAVVLYGWDENGWLMQNSWGLFFGNGGRCVVPYSVKF